jgi:hypothetical protein
MNVNIPSRFSSLSREALLYSLALSLALLVRLLNLGAAPLSDYEATWALQALHIAQPGGIAVALGPQMAYVALTGPLFFLFGSSNFLARLWPAIAGTLLVCLPILMRQRLGRSAALILAFGLAIDPGLVAASRTAGGPMLALSFGLLALILWNNRSTASYTTPVLAGLAGGLALLAGTAIFSGLLILALLWVFFRLVRLPVWPDMPTSDLSTPTPLPSQSQRNALLAAVISAGAILLLGGTLFLRFPQGIAGWASALPAYLKGWSSSSGVSAGILVLALLVYQPAAVLAGITGIIAWLVRVSLSQRQADEATPEDDATEPLPKPAIEKPPLLPVLWTLLGLLVVLLNPGRQVFDLVWVLPPLWMLAAWSLKTNLPGLRLNAVSLAHGSLILVLCTLFWITLITARLIDPLPDLPWPVVQSGVLLVLVVLGGLTTILIGMGWTWHTSRDGLAWGSGVVLCIYTIGALWGATQLRPNLPQELWGPQPGIVQADLFSKTLSDLSKWQTGIPDDIDIVSMVDTPSLRWVLRGFSQASFMAAPPPGKETSIVITSQEQTAPELAASYRGQDFLWSSWASWVGSLPPDFVNWLAFRKAPTQSAYIILWARADLKPTDSESQTDTSGDSPYVP